MILLNMQSHHNKTSFRKGKAKEYQVEFLLHMKIPLHL